MTEESPTMVAITQDEVGGPEVLRRVTVPRPKPGLNEVLVKVAAAGVNPADVMDRQFGFFSGTPPFTLGWDVSGTIEAVGPGVTVYSPGDEVFGLLPFPHGAGAYAQYAISPTRLLVPKPSSLTHVEAAAVPLAGLTAWQTLIDTAQLTEGQRVFINGASGGVGHLAVQIAHARGAYVIALASHKDANFVHDLGADEVIDYTSTDFTTAVRDVDVVLDVLGDDVPAKAVDIVKPGGIIVTTRLPSLAAATPAAKAAGVRLAGIFVESDRIGLLELTTLIESGRLRPTIAATYPLSEVAAAHSAHDGPGKIVIEVQ